MIGTDGRRVIINLRTEAFDIWLFTGLKELKFFIFLPRQKNLWAAFGAGKSPSA